MLWGSPIEISKQAQLKNRIKESLLKNLRILSAYNLTERDLSKHVRFLERYKPEYLYGYATILTAFAKMLDDANIKPPAYGLPRIMEHQHHRRQKKPRKQRQPPFSHGQIFHALR